MVSHNILATQLERYGIDGWIVKWMRNWLDDYRQRVNETQPKESMAQHPHGNQ